MTDPLSDIAPRTDEGLGEYFSRIRLLRGYSKTELARRAQVHLSTVQRIESGQVGGKKVKKKVQDRLAAALHVPIDYLKATTINGSVELLPQDRVCFSCWTPGTPPDSCWNIIGARYCMKCGDALLSHCSCGEKLFIGGRFCPHCGKKYGRSK